ncbi:MAG: response regulator [Candidatus Tectimicrobiota bacterium]
MAQILVIEDHDDSRRIIRDLLTHAGYEIREAVTGTDGVTAAATWRPDLILMDLQLPDISGYEATRRIKANPTLQHIPIIAVTAYAMSGDDIKAYAAGSDGYIAKPISPRALLATIRAYVA